MIEELYERVKYIKIQTEFVYEMMHNIQKYAKYGIGNIELLNYDPPKVKGQPKVKLFAGKLVSMQKKIDSDEDEELILSDDEDLEKKKKKGFAAALFSSEPKKKKPKPKKKDEKEENKEEAKTDTLNAYFESIDKKLNL